MRGWLWALLFLIILLIILSVGKRGFIQQLKLEKKTDELRENLETQKDEISRLEEEKAKLQTPEYKEKVAREKYGMAKENEKVYDVVPKEKKK